MHAAVTPPTTRGVTFGRMGLHTGVDALGAERDEHVFAYLESPVSQRLCDKFTGAADIGGGGQHDGLPGYGVIDHCGAGPRERAQVR